jgi:hypothetical protein
MPEFDGEEANETEISLIAQETTHLSSGGTFVSIKTGIVNIGTGKKKRPIVVAYDSCSNNTNISAELAEELGLTVLKKLHSTKCKCHADQRQHCLRSTTVLFVSFTRKRIL